MIELTIFKAEMAEKYGAPVYSRQPPTTAIFPDREIELRKLATRSTIKGSSQ